MKKSVVVLLHIGFWSCYLMMIMVMLGFYFRDEPEIDARIGEAFSIIFCFILVPSFITFYSFYLFIFPKYLKQQKFLKTFLYGGLISLFAGCVGYFLLWITVDANCFGEEDEGTLIELILFIAVEAMVAGVVALVLNGFITWFKEIQLKVQLKEKNQEMELALVKSQLDPHFLFNTINNIDVLILKNATVASDYLNKLSDIMRFMLYETKTDEILLSKEIEYIEKYIELQKIRTSNAKYVNFQITGSSNGKTIAPMVFIPLIENAFKHTNNKKVENAISIEIFIEKDSVHMECVNKFDASRKPNNDSNGLGNELIKKRLNLIYPNKHHLDVGNQNDLYRVGLTINLD